MQRGLYRSLLLGQALSAETKGSRLSIFPVGRVFLVLAAVAAGCIMIGQFDAPAVAEI